MGNASPFLSASFVALVAAVVAVFVAGIYKSGRARGRVHPQRDAVIAALCAGAWLAITGGLAAAGRLSFSDRPPTMLFLVAAVIGIAIALGASRVGSRLATGVPLSALVGAQAFRFPLELIMHRAATEGLMPVQMSFSGRNFDIVTGVSAIVVALVVARRPASIGLVRLWNAVGALLLVNVLVVALLSAPIPLRVFWNEPANVWISHAPWVWLPAVFVLAAIAGHIIVYRRLRHEAREGTAAATALPRTAGIAR